MRSRDLPRQIFRTRRFTLGVPERFTIMADGKTVLYLRSRAGDDPVTSLWALDLHSGSERSLADPADLTGSEPGVEPDQPGVTGYAASRDAGLVAFTLAGGLWVVDAGGGQARRLPAEGPITDPQPDPAGQRIAYVRDGAARMIEADGTDDRVIMAPDGPDVVFGVAEAEDGNRGYWWAPDGTRLLIARVDSSKVGSWYLADPAKPEAPARAIKYAAVGEANPEITLWIAGLDGTRTPACWDTAALEYLPRAGWDAHGPWALVQSRDQRTVRLLGFDPGTGAASCLAEQRDACWVQLIPGVPARSASGALIAHADQDGTRHLTVDGVTVTPPGLQLRAVLSVDEETVLFSASDEPTQVHLWMYRPGDGARKLTVEPGVHSGLLRAGTLVHAARGRDRPGGHASVRESGGEQAIGIPSLALRPELELHATDLVLGARELRATLYFPSWHQPGSGPLPVLVDPYGGAGRQRVTAELDSADLVSQWFAEQGFAVLVADGRGTPGRGPDWEREVYGDLFGPVLDDQVTALREAASRHPDLDLRRVGIRGWSFGGSLAAYAVLHRPDVFHVAVAGAGVTDQTLYNTHWRERFIGRPQEFPDWYEANSLVLAAPKLTRPLLLIHGLADTNVHPANTLRLSHALLAAGRPHEVLLLPGIGHAALNSAVAENLLWHQVRFLQRHLAIAEPG